MSLWRTIFPPLVAVLLPCAAASAQLVPAPSGKQWSPTFGAEFNAGQSDLTGWTYDTGNNNGWGNNEVENYTSSTNNVSVSGGALHLTAIGTQSGSNTSYTSGRIRTTNLFSQAYGL